MGPTESQNRFNRVFQQFIYVFSNLNTRWCFSWMTYSGRFCFLEVDSVTCCDPDSQYLLLIGAYRDNEVSASHPLMLTLEIQQTGAVVKTSSRLFILLMSAN